MKNAYRHDLEKFMREIGFHKEPIDSLLSAFDRVWENEKCRAYLLSHVDKYRDTGEIDFGMVSNDAALSAIELKSGQYEAFMLFDLCCAMYSYPVYEKKNLSKKVWIDSMSDFRFKLIECYKMYGEWGTFVQWFARFYSAECIKFNRLEFELETAPGDFECEDFSIKKGQRVVNVHIPSDEEIPLTKEECDRSYAEAAEFFAPYFTDIPLIFMCGSWLLHDAMRDFLPEDSNILRFASEYYIADTWDSSGDLWRIYYADYEKAPEHLPEETSLQRGYKRHLMKGGRLGAALGYKKHEKK